MSDATVRADPPGWYAENTREWSPPGCRKTYTFHALQCPEDAGMLKRNSEDHGLFHCMICGARFRPPAQGGERDE